MSSSAPPAPDDSRSDAERSADQQLADDAVLKLTDLPPGWESAPADDETNNDELSAELAECLDVDPTFFDSSNPTAESPTFTSAQDEQITSEVAVTASAEDAIERVEILRREDTPGCYATAIRHLLEQSIENPADGDEVPEGLELGDPTFNPMSFAALGDDTVAFRATIPVSAQGFDVEVYIDFVAVRVGRVGTTMTFQSQFSPFDTAEEERLTRIVVDRIPAGE